MHHWSNVTILPALKYTFFNCIAIDHDGCLLQMSSAFDCYTQLVLLVSNPILCAKLAKYCLYSYACMMKYDRPEYIPKYEEWSPESNRVGKSVLTFKAISACAFLKSAFTFSLSMPKAWSQLKIASEYCSNFKKHAALREDKFYFLLLNSML